MFRNTASIVLFLLVIGMVTAVSAQEANRAGLIIALEDGQTITRCVEFSEETISGYELLSRANVDLTTSTEAMGASVCGLEGVGCPADDCFCQCKGGGDCVYWSYWHLREDGWRYSQAGAGSFQVKDGMVEGWTWGPGSPQNAPQPPLLSFDEVCAAPNGSTVADQVIETEGAAESGNQNSLVGYVLMGLIVVVLGGLMIVKGGRQSA